MITSPIFLHNMVLTVSRASSLLLLCSLDVRSSGRIKSSAVLGSPGYKDTSSWSSGTPDTCSNRTTQQAGISPRWRLKFGLLLLNFGQQSQNRQHCPMANIFTSTSVQIHTRRLCLVTIIIGKLKKDQISHMDHKTSWLLYQHRTQV